MKIWTIQAPEVVEAILDKGVYYPDFNKSSFPLRKPEQRSIYGDLLNAYNKLNRMTAKGLIFGFMKIGKNGEVVPISSESEFNDLMQKNYGWIKSLAEYLKKRNGIVLELEYDIRDLYILPIDIVEYQFVMPPRLVGYPNSTEKLDRLYTNFLNGLPVQHSSGLIQVNIDSIRRENVVDMHYFRSFEY